MLELYHSEPNTFFLKPLVALHEKQASFQSRWFNSEQLDHFALNTTRDIEAHLHLEREGPLLRHDDTVISNSFFMIEYIADALPGEPLLPEAPYDIYRAHASGQFLGAHLGSLVPILGCVKYLVPQLKAMDRAKLDARLANIVPQERRLAWQALFDGTYTPEILATARERLKFPVARIEAQLASGPWLAGPRYSIADIDAFAMLCVLPDLTPEIVNESATPRILEYLARIAARPAVRAALAMSRSGKPEQHFVPGVEPSRWG
jgi:glutathione S-transferase